MPSRKSQSESSLGIINSCTDVGPEYRLQRTLHRRVHGKVRPPYPASFEGYVSTIASVSPPNGNGTRPCSHETYTSTPPIPTKTGPTTTHPRVHRTVP